MASKRKEYSASAIVRKPDGTFAKGTIGGPGRKVQPKKERPYLDAMYQEVTPVIWQGVIVKAIEQALDGDRYARKFLADYIIGPPVKRIQAAVAQGELAGSLDMDRQIIQVLAILQTVINTTASEQDTSDSSTIIDGQSELVE